MKPVAPVCIPAAVDDGYGYAVELLLYLEAVVVDELEVLNSFNLG